MTLVVPALLLLSVLLVPVRPGTVPVVATVAAAVAAVVVSVVGGVTPLTATLLVYTTALVAVIAAFSRRHLAGDVRRVRYDRLLLVASAAAVATVATDNVLVLLAGWVATGAAVTALVAHHDGLAATRDAVAALRRARLVGDLALVGSAGALAAAAGTPSLHGIAQWAAENASSPTVLVAGLLLVVATAARSGLWPFHRWIPLSVVAPAPVSALLHAGVVNAPVAVLLHVQPVVGGSAWVTAALVAVSLGTAVSTFPRLLVRADVKTRLAWSTTAQLAFMVLLVAVGAQAAAVAHLLAHGLYKANAFLWAGDQLSRLRKDRPLGSSRSVRVAGAVLGVALAATAIALGPVWQNPLTAVTVVVAGAAGGYGLMSLRATAGHRLAAFAVVAALVAALGAVWTLSERWWGVPVGTAGPAAWIAAAGIAALAVVGVVVRTLRPQALWARLHRLADPVVPGRLALGRNGSRRTALPAVASELGQDTRTDWDAAVGQAARAVSPTWGWQAFIATNPLWGDRTLAFEDAVALAARRGRAALPGVEPAVPADAAAGDRRARALDPLVAGWVAAWSAVGDVPWPAPRREEDLWSWWRHVAVKDPVLPRASRAWIATLPQDPRTVLDALVVAADADEARSWAEQELLRLPGWAGYVSRRDAAPGGVDVDALVALLAVRAVTAAALGVPVRPVSSAAGTSAVPSGSQVSVAGSSVTGPSVARALAALQAREEQVRSPLVARIEERAQHLHCDVAVPRQGRPAADLVFCIDTRSEPLRRALEVAGAYRTAGFAGFFGLPVARSGGDDPVRAHLPALLAPALCLHEAAPRAGVRDLLLAGLRQALDTPASGFATVDLAGLRALGVAVRTALPHLARPRADVRSPRIDVPADMRAALVDSMAGFLRATGFHGSSAAPLLVVAGHRSTSTNNPVESAFDCGACGGHGGGFNARLAAALLNAPDVREALARKGFVLPADTVAVAVEHDTATDEVFLLDGSAVLQERREALARVLADLDRAGGFAAAQREALRPDGAGATTTRTRSVGAALRPRNPGEVRHEWGLAGNALFIAAPRALTAGLDLGGRAFLHEYDAASDPDDALLTTIITAPLVVAHWINSQYLFSASDPEALGSGSKTAHNPVGGIGVLTGPGGDLRIGLAEQSVRFEGRPVLDPTRLLAVVAANPARIDAVLAAADDVRALVEGGWVALSAIDPGTGNLLRRNASGWQPYAEQAVAEQAVAPAPDVTVRVSLQQSATQDPGVRELVR